MKNNTPHNKETPQSDLLERAWSELSEPSFTQAQRQRFWERLETEETSSHPLEEQAWQELVAPPYTQAQQQRFWQRFETECVPKQEPLPFWQRVFKQCLNWLEPQSVSWSYASVAVLACALLSTLTTSSSSLHTTSPSKAVGVQHAALRPTSKEKKQMYKHLVLYQDLDMLEHLEWLERQPKKEIHKGG